MESCVAGRARMSELISKLFVNERLNLLDRQELAVAAAIVGVTERNRLSSMFLTIAFHGVPAGRRQNCEIATEVDCVETVARRNHFLVDLFAWTYANDPVLA